MRTDAPAGALELARKRFFNGEALPPGLVPAPILRSWQRCAAHGLSNTARLSAEPVSIVELREYQGRSERLRLLAKPELLTLARDAKLTESVVILTDADGLVLETTGSVAFADQASRVALRPGVHWNEDTTGTNAIGTSILEGRPIVVHGAQHFFEPHRMLTCSAAPIFDPAGQLAGVLDMSGHASVSHAHALGLVRLAAEQIEHRFFSRGFEDKTVLRFHRDPLLLGTPREAIFVFEGERLVAGNRKALKFFDLDASAFGQARRAELFERLTAAGEIIRNRQGEVFHRSPAGETTRPTVQVRGAVLPQGEIEPHFTAEISERIGRAVRLVEAGVPVLIHGETGTGKEVFARQVHKGCSRAAMPFVAVNCAALPEALIESELFGYEDGAFTGARKSGHKGLLRQAHGGVLFLDEIGDMPLALQSRLLRVLQDRQVTPLGGGQPVPVDFVVICATHRPLKALVDEGQFRADLYFRIAQYTLDLPALRDLPDRAKLISTLWVRLSGSDRTRQLSHNALSLLAGYAWPGNFRQLVGTLRGALALAEPGEPLPAAMLPADIVEPPRTVDTPLPPLAPASLDALTEAAMQQALEATGGNVAAAARRLGVDRSTLYRRVLRKSPVQ